MLGRQVGEVGGEEEEEEDDQTWVKKKKLQMTDIVNTDRSP